VSRTSPTKVTGIFGHDSAGNTHQREHALRTNRNAKTVKNKLHGH